MCTSKVREHLSVAAAHKVTGKLCGSCVTAELVLRAEGGFHPPFQNIRLSRKQPRVFCELENSCGDTAPR